MRTRHVIQTRTQFPYGFAGRNKQHHRDYANVSQLVCLSNLENLNAVFISEGISQAERLAKLNAIAISQMKVLTEDHRILQLDAAENK